MNVDELAELAQTIATRRPTIRHEVRVCMAASCQSSGAVPVHDALEKAAPSAAASLQGEGRRLHGPVLRGTAGGGGRPRCGPARSTLYRDVKPEDAADIIASVDGAPVERLRCPTDQPFFARQQRIVLENSGRHRPRELPRLRRGRRLRGAGEGAHRDDARARSCRRSPRAACAGAAAAATRPGLKWSTVAKMPTAQKYVVCNADEGDPGAFMDRGVLESDPHRVLEGMAIAAYAIGANKGYVYVRAEYPLAVERLDHRHPQGQARGLPRQQDLPRPSSDFEVEIRLGAGAFVCGEETALMASIEGKRGQPRPRPPYPAESGLWGMPDADQQRRDLRQHRADHPQRRRRGSPASARRSRKGTKVFALAGKIANTGLIEVPMGITLREIIEEIGGGIPGGKAFKAVQTGGPSGGCIPGQHLDIPVDYDSLKPARHDHGLRRHDRHGRDLATWSTWRATSWSSA